MSPNATRNEIVEAVKSTPFFGDYLSLEDINMHASDTNLFQVRENLEFAKKSGLFAGDNINVDWADLKTWLTTDGNFDEEDILKAFVRT